MVRRSLVLVVAGLALLAAGCGSGSSGGSDGSATKASTTTTEPTFAELDPTELTFRPVVAIVACEPTALDSASSTTTTTIAEDQEVLPGFDGSACYLVGPAGGDGTDVRDAKVYADGVGIQVSVREDDVAAMNRLFNACYFAIAACPASSAEGKGYVAVVVDGKVVSTPAIDAEDLASSPFVITGDFDQRQAGDIAAAINAL